MTQHWYLAVVLESLQSQAVFIPPFSLHVPAIHLVHSAPDQFLLQVFPTVPNFCQPADLGSSLSLQPGILRLSLSRLICCFCWFLGTATLLLVEVVAVITGAPLTRWAVCSAVEDRGSKQAGGRPAPILPILVEQMTSYSTSSSSPG